MHYKYDVLCRSNSVCTINMMYYVGVIVGAL